MIDNVDLCQKKWQALGEYEEVHQNLLFIGPVVFATMTGELFEMVALQEAGKKFLLEATALSH